MVAANKEATEPIVPSWSHHGRQRDYGVFASQMTTYMIRLT